MARRYCGNVVVEIFYVGESDGRSEYRGRVTLRQTGYPMINWPFSELRSGVGGPIVYDDNGMPRRVASDSPEAYDRMACAALSFASHYDAESEASGYLPKDKTEELSNHYDYSEKDSGGYRIRRSKNGAIAYDGD